LEVNEQEVLILADAAELPAEIDAGRAESARTRAETRLGQGAEEVDMARAKRALARSMARLDAVQRSQGRIRVASE
jgi:F-type H+-transporting ATPase subunit epsilon